MRGGKGDVGGFWMLEAFETVEGFCLILIAFV